MVHGTDAHHMLILNEQFGHLGIEVNLTARLQNLLPHVLNDAGQLVRADMRMGITQNGCGGTVLAEYVEDLLRIAIV